MMKNEHIINFVSFLITKLISLSIFAITVPYFINNAGSEKYGIIVMVLLIFNYLYLFDFGMGYAITYRFTRKLARNTIYPWIVISRGLPFYIISSILFGILLFIYSEESSKYLFNSSEYTMLFKLISISCFLLMFSNLFTGILIAYNKIYLSNISKMCVDIIKGLSLVIGILNNGNLTYVISTIVIGMIIKLIFDVYLVFKQIGNLKWLEPKISYNELILNLKFGSPMLVISLFALFVNSLDKVIISKYFSLEQLAYYSIAFDLNTKAYFLLAAINSTLVTLMIKKHALKENRSKLIKISFFSMFLIFIFYYVPLSVFAPEILTFWINSQFATKTVELIRFMIWMSLLHMIYDIFYNIYQTSGKVIINAYTSIVGALVLIISLYPFINKYELKGIVLSLICMYTSMILTLVLNLNLRFFK